MSNSNHSDSQASEEEEGEIREPKETKKVSESEEEDLVLRFGEESNESVEHKKRKRSIDDISYNKDKNYLNVVIKKEKEDEHQQDVKLDKEKDHLKAVEADLQFKMANKRVKYEFANSGQFEPITEIVPPVEIKIEISDDEDYQEPETTKEDTTVDNVPEEEDDDEEEEEEEEEEISPFHHEKNMKKNVFSTEALMKVQDIFGINFDNEIFGKYGKEEYDEEESDINLGNCKNGEKTKSTKKQTKKKSPKKIIYDIYEPNQLRRVYSVNLDKEICATDIPERMQLRLTPVTPTDVESNELDLESKWIYEQAFYKELVSIQNNLTEEEEERLKIKIHNRHHTIVKIRNVLHFIRNQQFEVPFIATYRKEFIYPELDVNDLWKIYKFDAKWCQLQQRKKHLLKLFENMLQYQLSEVTKFKGLSPPESMKIVKIADIEKLKIIDDSEEIHDMYRYFKLHYSHEIPAMKRFIRQKEYEALKLKLQKKGAKGNDDINLSEIDTTKPIEIERNDPYFICKKAGLDSFVKKFGITSEHFAENLRDSYQRYEVEQELYDPITTASRFCGKKISAPEKILKSAQFMFALQLACEPLVRKTLRNLYMKKAKLTVRATKKGIREIDENHPIYTMKYLKNKPVKDLVGDQFLKLVVAEQDDLITITFSDIIEGVASNNYIDEIKQFLTKQENNQTVLAWNALRISSMEMALTTMVIIDLKKELRANLLFEAKDCVMRECCQKLQNWLKVAPYTSNIFCDDEEDWSLLKGIRVMGLSFPQDETQISYACIVAQDGDCTDFLKLPHLLKRRNSTKESDRLMKETELLSIRNFIATKKPHVIAIAGESRDALMIQFEINEIIMKLRNEENFPAIKVEICDNDLTKIYANGNRAISEFRDYSSQLKQAISIARRLQDPLIEFSQLCNTDDEILSLKYHSLQDQLPQDELLENIHTEFINVINQIGVNVNMVAQKYYAENLLQFVCGLGPRKAQALIKIVRKQTDQKLENRAQLVTICNLEPKVFINCAGFIKIDADNSIDNKGAYVEVLDGSRIHPESYEWARKIAVDALELEEDPNKAIIKILQTPEKLKDLDLDSFIDLLQRQGYGDKKMTMYDICAELSCMYRDLRRNYVSPNAEQLFYMLTKETPETLHVGRLIVAKVLGISHKKPQGEQMENMRPVRNDETGFWQCPFCFKNDFLELSEVWTHFDTTCPGRATGVKIRLENGLTGYIHIKNLSDKTVTNPRERVCANQPIHCRIMRIDVEKFGIECTSRSKDLADKDNEWKAPKDPFYDMEGEEKEKKLEEEVRKSKLRQAYIKRIIGHPFFKNIDFADAERLMSDKNPGEIIIRPSSKGPNHLTITWKMADEVIQHIDVIEEGKANDFLTGAKLRIGSDEFEDLDDIFVRHINPMIGFVNEILSFKYYKPRVGGNKDRADEVLKMQKRENPNGIPYIISAARQYPGNFLLSYLPRNQCRHEYFSIIPEGMKFRTEIFVRLNDLLRWFKENFKEPVPTNPPIPSRGTPPPRTPYQSTSTGIRNDEFPQEIPMSHRPYANQSMYPNNQIYPPNRSDYHSDYSKRPEYINRPEYPRMDYPQNRSEYPPSRADYPPNRVEYPPNSDYHLPPSDYSMKSNYRSNSDYPSRSDYPPIRSDYGSPHSDYPHSDYPPSRSDYPPSRADYPPRPDYTPPRLDYPPRADYPPSRSDYPPPSRVDYPSSRSDYLPPRVDYPPKSNYPSNQSSNTNKTHYQSKTSYPQKQIYESNEISYPSQEKNKISEYNGKGLLSRNSESPPTEKTSLTKIVPPAANSSVSSPILPIISPLVPPQPTTTTTTDDVIIISHIDKNQETIGEKKQLKPTISAAIPKPNLTWSQQIQNKVFDDTYFTKTKKIVKPYDNGVGHGLLKKLAKGKIQPKRGKKKQNDEFGSRESSLSKDDFSRGSSRDKDYNPFAIGSSNDDRRYDSPHGDRSPSYQSRNSRERSPKYGSRSSWDRSPTYGSNNSRERKSSWDRSSNYGRNSRSRSRSPYNSREGRPSWDRSPEYQNNSPSPDRSPQFGSDYVKKKVQKKLPPPLQMPIPDDENPFVKGSSRDQTNGASSPTPMPKKLFPFNRGRGRGFKSYTANSRGRGAKYDIVTPCGFPMPRRPYNGS